MRTMKHPTPTRSAVRYAAAPAFTMPWHELRVLYVFQALASGALAGTVCLTHDWACGIALHFVVVVTSMGICIWYYPGLIMRSDPYVALSFLMWMDVAFALQWLGVDSEAIRLQTMLRLAVMSLVAFSFMCLGMCCRFPPVRRAAGDAKARQVRRVLIAAFICIAMSAPLRLYSNHITNPLSRPLPLYVLYYPLLAAVPGAALAAIAFARRRTITTGTLSVFSFGIVLLDSSRRAFVTLVCILVCTLLQRAAERGYSKRIFRSLLLKCTVIGMVVYCVAAARRSYNRSDRTWGSFQKEFAGFAGRARAQALIPDFAFTVEAYPQRAPHLWGSTILSLLVNPVPRRWWSGKPIGMSAIVAYNRMGLMTPSDYAHQWGDLPSIHSFSPSFVAEMWANFGWVGIVAGSFLLTVLYRALEALNDIRKTGILWPLYTGSLLSAVIVQNRGCFLTANFFPLCAVVIGTLALVVAHRVDSFGSRGRLPEAS